MFNNTKYISFVEKVVQIFVLYLQLSPYSSFPLFLSYISSFLPNSKLSYFNTELCYVSFKLHTFKDKAPTLAINVKTENFPLNYVTAL